ncbi:hypothetical protein [Sphingomonas sp.]|uniref:hypothetical protein n=1 Tax=Sphingomonas sp. TaxID=28214 RepID=UPI002DD62A6B|nr:hypothetical protein [Sphingomonas sp.]
MIHFDRNWRQQQMRSLLGSAVNRAGHLPNIAPDNALRHRCPKLFRSNGISCQLELITIGTGQLPDIGEVARPWEWAEGGGCRSWPAKICSPIKSSSYKKYRQAVLEHRVL